MKHLLATLFTTSLIAGCAGLAPGTEPVATARMQATTGNTVTGVVNFAKHGDKVLVSGELRGFAPNTEHGFHIHEKGDCSSGDGMSAGGHFNPDAQQHGAFDHAEHHVGDLRSLKADATGVAKFSYESTSLSVDAGPKNIIGRGLIVHQDPDDFKTQPTGNSGARVSCGVIGKS